MLEREMFQKRKDRGQPIGLHELVYPVLQGYDSVKIHSDVTVVGQDQVFNENVGRILQERYGQKPQLIVGLKILPGIDGKEKMSQSLGNAIALSASAEEQFGKLMAIPDDVVETYAELLTDLDMLVVRERMERGGVSARNEKGEVAKAIVSQLYGDEHAAIAAAMFEKRFSKKELPHDLTCHEVPYGRRKIIDLLVDVRFVKSRSEARRVIEQGGVEINGKRMKDPKGEIEIPQTNEGIVLKVGKWRKPVRVVGRR
jgi:tyrosyl-tRNA synthetase